MHPPALEGSENAVDVLRERQLSPEMADTSSFDASTSSSDTGFDVPIPLLVSVESPLVSAVVAVLNATNLGHQIFTNGGHDRVEHINYNHEWWRQMPDLGLRVEKTEEQWQHSVLVDLQVLSAFLDGHMQRRIAATGDLESLFRLKKSRDEELPLTVPTIFKLLAEVPELAQALVSTVRVDGEIALILPVPVAGMAEEVSIQRATDDTFWSANLDPESDETEIPYLESLTDIFVVYCLDEDIAVQPVIYPERYSQAGAERVQQRLAVIRDLNRRQNEVQAKLRDLSQAAGQPVLKSLEVAIEALNAAHKVEAAKELEERTLNVKEDLKNYENEAQQLLAQLEQQSETLLEFSDVSMTPYQVRALLWPDAEQDDEVKPPVVIIPAEEGMWHFLCGSTYYKIEWRDVVKYALNSEKYLVFYERAKHVDRASDAPSVTEFIEKDNAVSLNREVEGTDKESVEVQEEVQDLRSESSISDITE